MSRAGCIPQITRKWAYYANEILRPHPSRGTDFSGLEFSQALLQHYGWRSFFIDFTKKFEVACWFASHAYQEQRSTEVTEDFEEQGLFLFHKNASYSRLTDGNNGHIYIIEIEKTRAGEHNIIDLTVLPEDLALRPSNQHGWLVGPKSAGKYIDSVNPNALVAHIQAPRSVLQSMSNLSMEDLFPDGDEDFFLRFLELLPWTHIENDINCMFQRAIEIPDYYFKPRKRYPPENTFFKKFWISENLRRFQSDNATESPMHKSLFIRVEEAAFHHNELLDLPLRNLKKLLNDHSFIVIESDNLICYPGQMGTSTYTKGISIFTKNEEVFVATIALEHPGQSVRGLGVDQGYCYFWSGEKLVRNPHSTDCPCGDTFKHERLVTILAGIDSLLVNAKKIDDRTISIL
jgi:hypothetical protein